MNKGTKIAVASVVGAAGIVALGALTLTGNVGASTEESDRFRSRHVAAKANNANHVTAPASKGSKFGNVVLTHQPDANCSRTEGKDDDGKDALIITCTNVGTNVMGDAVYVHLPSKDYKVEVLNTVSRQGKNTYVTLRDYALMSVDQKLRHVFVSWQGSDVPNANRGWAVGVDAFESKTVDVKIWVTKTN